MQTIYVDEWEWEQECEKNKQMGNENNENHITKSILQILYSFKKTKLFNSYSLI